MKNKSKGKNKKNVFYDLLIIFFVIIIIVCGIYIVYKSLRYKDGQNVYDSIKNEYYDESSKIKHILPLPSTPDYYTSLEYFDSDLTVDYSLTEALEKSKARLYKLKEKYSELYGWISIENSKVDYPLMIHSDNEYYLNHGPDGNLLVAGAINVDYRNSMNVLENKNLVIYGHNLYDGNMFHALVDYTDEAFFRSHRNVTIYTFDGIYKYKIFSISKVNERDDYIRTYFYDNDQFLEFANKMKSRSMFQVDDVSLNVDSRILTLSTCTNVNPAERYSIQAVLVEVVK